MKNTDNLHSPTTKANPSPYLTPYPTAGGRVLRLPAVIARVGMSRSWIYDNVSKANFPAPIQLGAKAIAWLEDEIDEWLANRVAASRSISGNVH